MASTPKDISEKKIVKEEGVLSLPIQDIIRKALISDNPLIQRALVQEQAFRAKTEKELSETLSVIQKYLLEQDEPKIDKIKAVTLERLDTDLELITRLNTALEAYHPKDTEPKDYAVGDHNACTYPAKFNKMALGIPGAKTLIKAKFPDIFRDGTLPEGYLFRSKPSDVTVLGNNATSIYGNSKGTFLKIAALNVALSCGDHTNLQNIMSIEHSAMAHVTALPENLNLTRLDPRFSKFTYLFSDLSSSSLPYSIKQGLVYIHHGYAFGGHRDTASRYKDGTKSFGPEDCSSWISKFCGSATQFSTIDQLYVYRLSVFKQFHISLGVVPEKYETTAIVSTMSDLFDPVIVKDPQRDIRSGQIYAHRSYDLSADATMQGPGSKGGHTGLVLDFVSAGKDSSVVIMAYGRNMPETEGFGVQSFPYTPEDRRVMLFSVKSKIASEGSKSSETKLKAESVMAESAKVATTASSAIATAALPPAKRMTETTL